MKLPHPPKAAAWLLACISLTAGAVLPTVPSPAAEPASASFAAASLLQAGLGLAVVIGLIFLFAWGVRRFGLQPSGNGRLLKVVSSIMVGQRERVVVVEIGGSWLVLGVAAGQVRTLHTMPAEKQPEVQAASINSVGGGGVFSQKLLESVSRLAKRKRDSKQ
jgi:flagellar protein FliO/FliZ